MHCSQSLAPGSAAHLVSPLHLEVLHGGLVVEVEHKLALQLEDDLLGVRCDVRDVCAAHEHEQVHDQRRRLAQNVVRLAAVGLEAGVAIRLLPHPLTML
eukprot:2389764-Pyramimonas_sp.AAC.1